MHEGRCAQVRLDARVEQCLLAALEEPPKVRIRSGPRRAQHEALQPIGMLGGDDLANGAAGGVAHEVGGADPESIHQTHGVVGHLFHGIADPRVRAAAGAAMVMDDRAKAAREVRHL